MRTSDKDKMITLIEISFTHFIVLIVIGSLKRLLVTDCSYRKEKQAVFQNVDH